MRITNTIIKKNDHIVETVNRNLKKIKKFKSNIFIGRTNIGN